MAERVRKPPASDDGPTPDWIKSILSGQTPGADTAASDGPKRESKPFFTHPVDESEGGSMTHEGMPGGAVRQSEIAPPPQAKGEPFVDWPDRLKKGNGPSSAAPTELPDRLPTRFTSDQQAPEIPGVASPRIESWMNKNPNTWYPKESQEWTRWRKQLTTAELYAWEKMRMETAKWHQATRQPGGLARAMADPAYGDYRRRYDEFMKRTVPRWRQHEQRNPPRHYRQRMSAVEALGGLNSEENGVG